MPAPEATVFVVDDDAFVRQALEGLLRSGGWRAETFDSAAGFLARERPMEPHCLLLDLELPDVSGLELQRQLRDGGHTETPVIFLTGHGDIASSVRAMKAGALEFLTKPFGYDDVVASVALAIETSSRALLLKAELLALRERHASLSPRERRVMSLVVAGLLNKQVAAELGITEGTVKLHRAQVMAKMQADSFASLVRASLVLSS